jgi:hypothetical protein
LALDIPIHEKNELGFQEKLYKHSNGRGEEEGVRFKKEKNRVRRSKLISMLNPTRKFAWM